MVAKMNPISFKWYRGMLEKAKCTEKDWILSGLHMSNSRSVNDHMNASSSSSMMSMSYSRENINLFKPDEMLKMSRFITNQLKNPSLPCPTLQRENEILKTKTLFQDILASFVFDEQDKYDEIDNRL